MEEPIYDTFCNGEFIVNYVLLLSRFSSVTLISEMTLKLENEFENRYPSDERNKYTILNNHHTYNYKKIEKLKSSPFEFDVIWSPHSKTIRGDRVYLLKKLLRSNAPVVNSDTVQSQNTQQNVTHHSISSNTSSFQIIISSREEDSSQEED